MLDSRPRQVRTRCVSALLDVQDGYLTIFSGFLEGNFGENAE